MQPTFRDLIAANRRNTFLLVLLFCLFFAATAGLIALAVVAYAAPDALDWREAVAAGGVAMVVCLALSWIGYYSGAGFVLAVSGARRIEHDDDPELFNVVEEMAIAAGAPMPAVYLIDDPAPNAFATGRDPKHAAVTVTTGLRRMMTRDELQGVIAHEMSHVRNYDIRLMLMMTVLVGSIVMLCDLFWQMVRFGPSRSSSRSRDRDGGGGGVILLILVVAAVILAILAPLLAQMIQLAVSRQREYLADASAVELTRYPQGLANALRKIAADEHVLTHANRGTAHLWIANPIEKYEARANSPFASHPPIEQRIRRLEALVREPESLEQQP
jgi:heat shock protein HtpX